MVPGKDFSRKLLSSDGNFTTSLLRGTVEPAGQEMRQDSLLKCLPSCDNESVAILLLGGTIRSTSPRAEDSTFCPQRELAHMATFSLTHKKKQDDGSVGRNPIL